MNLFSLRALAFEGLLSLSFHAFMVNGQDCLTSLSPIFQSEAIADISQLREYIICPNTDILTGFATPTGEIVDGDPPLVLRSNAHLKCGQDGSSSNNCAIFSGQFAIFLDTYNFYGDLSIDNVVIQGITIKDFTLSGDFPVLIQQNRGSISFIDVIYKGNAAAPSFLVNQIPLELLGGRAAGGPTFGPSFKDHGRKLIQNALDKKKDSEPILKRGLQEEESNEGLLQLTVRDCVISENENVPFPDGPDFFLSQFYGSSIFLLLGDVSATFDRNDFQDNNFSGDGNLFGSLIYFESSRDFTFTSNCLENNVNSDLGAIYMNNMSPVVSQNYVNPPYDDLACPLVAVINSDLSLNTCGPGPDADECLSGAPTAPPIGGTTSLNTTTAPVMVDVTAAPVAPPLTAAPTVAPTMAPTAAPTVVPVASPTPGPTLAPASEETPDPTSSTRQTLSEPITQWVTSIPPANYGNSVTMSPDGTLAIFTGAEGSVTALNTADGSFAWQFTPDLDTTVFSNSGITISSSEEFFVVGISGGFEQVDPSYCTVYSITFDGTATAFPTLDGQCSGTPLLSSDDSYVFLTHNLAASGTFSILDVASTSLYFSNTDDTQPYSPPGIYFNPSEGYYPGGEGNPNDILVWAYTPTADEQGVGTGATFAFQFPIGFFDGFDASGLFITTVNDNVNWQAIAPPKLTNFGYSMYFSVSRSQWRGWVGAPVDVQNRFNRDASFTKGYTRGDPSWQAIFAPLALSSSTETPMLFGGTASTLFVGFDFEMNEMWQLATTFPVYSEAKVSPDDTVVYFVEQNGFAQAVDATTGTSIFNSRITVAPITANFALTASGRTMIVVDESGSAQALQVAGVVTEAPVTRAPAAPTTPAPVTMPPVTFTTPTPTPFPTTMSATPAPISVVASFPPNPGFPRCSICGDGLRVTLPDAELLLLPGTTQSCLELETVGLLGYIDANFCPIMPTLVSICGCAPGEATVSPIYLSPPPTSMPITLAPVTPLPTTMPATPVPLPIELIRPPIPGILPCPVCKDGEKVNLPTGISFSSAATGPPPPSP